MRKALGRGLDALLPSHSLPTIEPANATPKPLKVPIDKIRPNHLQPRRYFDAEKLSELSASIRAHGLAQPLVVSSDPDGTFELIAGERRLRACELAGLKEVDVVVRQPENDKQRLALALIENLQREDLNAVETALGYVRLMREFGINQTDLGQVVGKSKQTISNTLRMLDLPEEIQKAIQAGQLQEGHGRALLAIKDPTLRHKIFQRALAENLAVRDLEDIARQLNGVEKKEPVERRPVELKTVKSADVLEFERLLQQRFGTKVEIRGGKDAREGTLVIHYHNLEDFDRIIGMINK
ncbi:MAG: ParB/RepB/Spo0J family partition protein [Elusimicrobia bacterium]|nr:ParB/RepB/Spo0J family partition protein [Elusimicrobiota bacterium]